MRGVILNIFPALAIWGGILGLVLYMPDQVAADNEALTKKIERLESELRECSLMVQACDDLWEDVRASVECREVFGMEDGT
jgi:hypothetical protein